MSALRFCFRVASGSMRGGGVVEWRGEKGSSWSEPTRDSISFATVKPMTVNTTRSEGPPRGSAVSLCTHLPAPDSGSSSSSSCASGSLSAGAYWNS